MIFEQRLCSLFLLLATFSCSADGEPQGAEADSASFATNTVKRAGFAELGDVLTAEQDFVSWYTLKANLRRDFDGICGDTFCEGDYGNYQSLALQCAVDLRRNNVERCVWVFAASQQELDPATGAISVTARHWECALPLASRTRVKALLALSTVEEPLYAPLPGTDRSAYDGLVDCL